MSSLSLSASKHNTLGTDQWHNNFPNAILENLPATSSNHYPIMQQGETGPRFKRNLLIFKFENVWLLDPDFVKDKWNTYCRQA